MRPIAILVGVLAASTLLGGCLTTGSAPYLESQQQELERRLSGTPVKVIRKGDTVILRMPSDVTFAFDRADIDPGFRPVLDTMADAISHYPATRVEVSGHADATGTEAYNQALSERRAAAVGAYLAGRGVARATMRVQGFGETEPVTSNDTEEDRAANRRVEVLLRPAAAPPLAGATGAAPATLTAAAR